jgi:hypothetical protein
MSALQRSRLFLGARDARNDLVGDGVGRITLQLQGQDFAQQRAECAGITK